MDNLDPTAHLPWQVRLRLVRRNAEHGIRNLLLALVRRFCRSTPRGGTPSGRGVRAVLIIRTGKALGDAVMSLCLVPALRKTFPCARVDLLLRDSIAPLFREGSGADQVLELHPRFLKHPLATVRLLRLLRRRHYDGVIACDNPYKSSFTTLCLALWTGAPRRIGFDNDESRGFLTDRVESHRGEAMVKNLTRLLGPLGQEAEATVPRLEIPESVRLEVASVMREGKDPVVIFASNHWRKSWPLAAFVKVASGLTSRGYTVWLALGPGDSRGSDPLVRSWLEEAGECGKLLSPQPIVRFAALLGASRLFIANDCGPYHIGVAAGARTIGIFLTPDSLLDFSHHAPGRLVALRAPDPVEGVDRVLAVAQEILKAGK